MSGDIPLTPEDVAEIVSILDGSGYERLDLRTRRFALRVAREGGGWNQEWEQASAFAPAEAEAARPVMEGDADTERNAVRAPLPGTFYRAPQPGAPPFVEVGDAVEPDTVVGIIETMKLMNPVHAGMSGTVEAVLADNAVAIDAGTVLMRIAPAS